MVRFVGDTMEVKQLRSTIKVVDAVENEHHDQTNLERDEENLPRLMPVILIWVQISLSTDIREIVAVDHFKPKI